MSVICRVDADERRMHRCSCLCVPVRAVLCGTHRRTSRLVDLRSSYPAWLRLWPPQDGRKPRPAKAAEGRARRRRGPRVTMDELEGIQVCSGGTPGGMRAVLHRYYCVQEVQMCERIGKYRRWGKNGAFGTRTGWLLLLTYQSSGLFTYCRPPACVLPPPLPAL